MQTDSEKPSTPVMLLKIVSTTLIMAGVVFMIAGASLLPGLPLLVCGIGLLVVASQMSTGAAAESGDTA